MNNVQKEILTDYFNAYKKARDDYEKMPFGLALSEQTLREQRFDYFREFVVGLIEMYTGKKSTDLFAELYDAENIEDLDKYIK